MTKVKFYKAGLECFKQFPEMLVMNSEQEKHRLWFESVVAPKMDILKQKIFDSNELRSFDFNKFFKEFLADLEMLGLDNYSTEAQVDRIILALTVVQDPFFQSRPEDLRDVALISSLKNVGDRFLFWSKWRKYQLFIKAYGTVDDATILDAYRVSSLLHFFISDISYRIELLLQGQPAQTDAQAS